MPNSYEYNSRRDAPSHHDRSQPGLTLPPIQSLITEADKGDSGRSAHSRVGNPQSMNNTTWDPKSLPTPPLDDRARGHSLYDSAGPPRPPHQSYGYPTGIPPPAQPGGPVVAIPGPPPPSHSYHNMHRGYGPTSPGGPPGHPAYGSGYQQGSPYQHPSTSSNGYPSPYSDPSPGSYGRESSHSVNGYEPADDRPTRRRRGNLPKWSTDYLKQWFFDHIAHPYPTEAEKQELCKMTGLGMTQLSNWFINARRRQQPVIHAQAHAETMIRDSSNHTSSDGSPGMGHHNGGRPNGGI